MPLPATQPQPLTYADYLTWDDGQRWEIIDGEAFCMSPSPATEHQVIAGDVYAQLSFQLRGKRCQPFIAPLDVRLPKPGQDDATTDRVVQPDVLVVCDPAKYDHRGVRGAPDFVVEVLSRSTMSHDHLRKRRVYESAGVREYWLVHPGDRIIFVYTLQDGSYSKPEIRFMDEPTPIGVLEEVAIDWAPIVERLGPQQE
jgi:Uma2 family endonuclease